MKTTILTLLLFYLLSTSLYSQEYIPMLQEGNSWGIYLTDAFGPDPPYFDVSNLVEVGEETMINGQIYRTILLDGTEFCFLREANGIVYYYDQNSSSELVFLDFTVEIGDSLFLDNNELGMCLSPLSLLVDELRVIDVQQELIAGEERKVIYFDYYSGGSLVDLGGSDFKEILIEGIGSTGYIGLRGFTFDTGYELTCFNKNGEITYFNNNTQCTYEIIIGVDEFNTSNVNFVPNPATDVSVLRLPEYSTIDIIKLFDINGGLVQQAKIHNASVSIKVNTLESGLYIYKLYSKGKIIESGKLIVK